MSLPSVIPGERREAMRGKGIHFTARTIFTMDSLPLALLPQGSAGNDRESS